MLLWITLACDPAADEDSGATLDTAATTDSGDTDDTDDTEDSGDSGTPLDSGDSGEPQDSGVQDPTYTYVAGTTGIQIDLTYSGTPAAEDMVRYGLWLNREATGSPDLYGETSATFPQSYTAETSAGSWQVSTFYDVGGNNPTGPGEEDFSVRWENAEGIAYNVEVQEGFTTIGVSISF